jgi:hypothetical protein
MNAGQLVTMQIFSFFVFGPLQEIGNILLSYREAEASLNNFDTLMNKAPELEPAIPKSWAIQKLSFNHVSFKHQTASHKAIDDISFNVQQRRDHCICWSERKWKIYLDEIAGWTLSAAGRKNTYIKSRRNGDIILMICANRSVL